MDWIQVLTIIGANLGVFLWIRSETRNDMRTFETELRSWKNEINTEMKDFHGRLCAIEERGRK